MAVARAASAAAQLVVYTPSGTCLVSLKPHLEPGMTVAQVRWELDTSEMHLQCIGWQTRAPWSNRIIWICNF